MSNDNGKNDEIYCNTVTSQHSEFSYILRLPEKASFTNFFLLALSGFVIFFFFSALKESIVRC